MIDLHTHSYCSDGSLSPAQLVKLAEEGGLSAVALTDHDTVDGIDEALNAASSDITVIPGIEFSASIGDHSMHILGLFINHKDAALQKVLFSLKQMRDERNLKVIANLKKENIPVTLQELQHAAHGKIIGRPHFAEVMVQKGYVKDIKEAFDKYLGDRSSIMAKKERLTPEEVIFLINGAGGVPVLAHPHTLNLKNSALKALLGSLAKLGLKGIECFYSGYEQTRIEKFSRLAKEFGLVRSGGSDFHGDKKPDIMLGRGTGSLYIHDSLLMPIKNLARSVKY